jgi:hypothetical protein
MLKRIRRQFAMAVGLAFLIAGSLGNTTAPARASDAALSAQGLELARVHCGRCHIVSEDDRFMGISSTPSFKIMIEVLQDWEDRFATFMARNPHPAHIRLKTDDPRPENQPVAIKEVLLDLDDIEAIMAYVESMAVELGKK